MVTAHWFTYGGEFTGTGVDLPTDQPAAPLELLLEQMPVAAYQAYSMRRLSAHYDGPAITVRRSTDNTTMDIGFGDDHLLDTDTLLEFVGSGSGFVATWYDQSGNDRHMTQTVAASQPQLVAAGVVNLIAGQPALTFGSDRHVRHYDPGMAELITSTGLSVCEVHEDRQNTISYGETDQTSSGGRLIPFFWSSASPPLLNTLFANDAGANQTPGGSFGVAAVGEHHADVFVKPNGPGARRYRDGSVSGLNTTSSITVPTGTLVATIGGWANNTTESAVSHDYSGRTGEHIMFAGALDAPEVAILHGSQSSYFALP